jgi:acetyl esterase/lipase
MRRYFKNTHTQTRGAAPTLVVGATCDPTRVHALRVLERKLLHPATRLR